MSTLWDMLAPLARRLWQQAHDSARERKKPPIARRITPAAVKPPTSPGRSKPRRARPNSIAVREPASLTPQAIPAPAPAPVLAPVPASAEARYEHITRLMLDRYGIKVRKWRTSMSGIAWELRYRDGSVKRLIEAPKPKGPMSAAVFLHEIGHHAIGFNRYKPRCLEEYHAWAWAIAAMHEHGVTVTDSVKRRMHASLAYAVAKARRRGLAVLPEELEPFQAFPPRRAS